MKQALIITICLIVSGGCVRNYKDTVCPCIVKSVEYGDLTKNYYIVADGTGADYLNFTTKTRHSIGDTIK